MSGPTNPLDYFQPLRDLAMRLQSDAESLDRQAALARKKAAELREESNSVYGAWQRLVKLPETSTR